MIACSTVQKESIRSHYDLSTVFYRLLWGRHIHHGLWSEAELASNAAAKTSVRRQQRLTETLAAEAGIRPGETVLDVGCGMGSSSIHLARQLACEVTGVTISPVQRRWAQCCARWHGVSSETRFLCADAEQIVLPPAGFDVVWSVECTEHLFDKPRFFRAGRAVAEARRAHGDLRLAGRQWLDANRKSKCTKSAKDFFAPRWEPATNTLAGWPTRD